MTTTPSTMKLALSIWARAIILNSLLIGIYMFFKEGFKGSFFLVLSLIIGFFVTLPILVVMPLIIKLAANIPYSVEGRLAGLSFFLVIIAVLYNAAVAFLFGGNFFDEKYFHLIVLAAAIAVVLATRSVKSSFSKLNSNNHEQQLV